MKKLLIISALCMGSMHIHGAAHPAPAQERRHILINLKPENVSLQTAVYETRENRREMKYISDILIQGSTLERRIAMLKSVCAYKDGISPVAALEKIMHDKEMQQTFIKELPDEELEDEAFDQLSKPQIAIRSRAKVLSLKSYGDVLVAQCTQFFLGENGKCVLVIPSTNQVSEQALKEYVARANVKEVIVRAQQDPSKYDQLARMLASWKFYEQQEAPVRFQFRDVLYDEAAPVPVQEPKSLTAVMWIEP